MNSRTRAAGVAAVVILALVLVALGGCFWTRGSSRTPTPAAVATSTPAPSTSTAPSASPTPSATPSTPPTYDTEGGAIGTSITVSGQKKPAVGNIAQPTDAVAAAQAKKVLDAEEGANITSAKAVAMTQDKKGHWWVLLEVNDTTAGEGKAVISYDGKTWSDQGWGVTINTSDLPPDVKF